VIAQAMDLGQRRELAKAKSAELAARILRCVALNPEMSPRDVATRFGVSYDKVKDLMHGRKVRP